jgi:tetratricopeptide (TPR) repeat protein
VVDQVSEIFTKLGASLELSGRFEQALQAYEEMRSFAQTHHDRPMELIALMSLATLFNTFTAVHNTERGEQTLKQALEISRETGDLATQARLNWNLMLNTLFTNRLDPALEYGLVALDLARRSGNRENLAFVLNDLCRVHICRGEFEDAHRVNREARDLWRELDNQVMLADNLGSASEAFFNSGNFESALETLDQALQLSENNENLWGQAYDRMLISFTCYQQGLLGKGIQYAEQAIELADKGGLIAMNNMRAELAWIYAYCGAFDKALELIERSLQVATENQPDWIAFPRGIKARIQLLQGEVASAIDTRGPKLLEPMPFPYARFQILLLLANIEIACIQSDYQTALALSDELLLTTGPLTRIDIPEALRWKAAALRGLDRLDEARQILSEARELAVKTGSNLHLWPILVDLADLNQKLGAQQQAESDLREARDIVERIAASLREVGLTESFLSQPRVKEISG